MYRTETGALGIAVTEVGQVWLTLRRPLRGVTWGQTHACLHTFMFIRTNPSHSVVSALGNYEAVMYLR